MASDSHFVQFILNNESDTALLARVISGMLKRGDTIALAGELGVGKTTFTRALIQSVLPGEEVPSPTFTLVQTYDGPSFRITHADLYRIKSKRELRELGFEEALESGVLVIEWPDRMSELLPADRLDIMIEVDDGAEERRVKMIGRGDWADRMRQLGRRGFKS
jgi:tRNA threonylcarbamoyl adenosine modification protein YjeE